jgi:formylglycine-generating enzyme
MRLASLLTILIVATIGASSATTVEAEKPACPPGMVLVDGEYCPQPKEVCLDWMDPPDAAARRCSRYEEHSECLVPTVHKRFCIERTEHLEANGSRLPIVSVDAYQAEAICKKEGTRLCYESEHLAACQGRDWRPYPQGWTRDCSGGNGGSGCNCDVSTNIGEVGHRTDKRRTPEQTAGCVSQYGVLNLVGSVDEWWLKDLSASKYDYVLRSGHWLTVRDRCTGATTAHSPLYSDSTAGFRCCQDAGSQ